MSTYVLQDFVPFGGAALLTILKFTIMQSRASGIADRILPLGDLLKLIEQVFDKG